MSSINHHTREINVKMVYYGPGLGGKTTSLRHIHRALPEPNRGEMVSLATAVDRTLFFDFLPVKLKKIAGFTIRMSLYTVPGQVHYNATRKLVLQGADGVVFVADSQEARRIANIESLQNLDENLRGHGLNPDKVPLVIQYNKRDLPNIMPVEQLDEELRLRGEPAFETCALDGNGIFKSLKEITRLVLHDLKDKGIYRDKEQERPAPEFASAPMVSPSVERTLVHALETRSDLHAVVPEDEPKPELTTRGMTLSDLWEAPSYREQVLAVESDIERGDFSSAVRRSDGILREYVGASTEAAKPLAEPLLLIGVHGAFYARLCEILGRTEHTKQDALFCLFFVTDVELRMHAADPLRG
ncbi:MAG: ADP-ribosylation factor-like protein [bacterium]